MASSNVPCCTAQNDTRICAESTIQANFVAFVKQLQYIELFKKIIPTRYFFFLQLSNVLYKSSALGAIGWQSADKPE